MKPQRRKDGLVVKELPDEVLVYDRERHRAHCLNPTAALVFKQCDGETSVEEIARLLRAHLDAPTDEQWVHLALDRLEKAHLLQPPREGARERNRLSRRELLRRAGLASAALLPIVTSLLAPSPAEAVATCVVSCTGKPFGTPCNFPSCDLTCDSFGNCV